METVNLYSRQHENSLQELNSQNLVTNKKIYIQLHLGDISDFFLERYDYFVQMAEKRVNRPTGIEYPIWCSISKYNCLKAVDKSVVYCLSVPKNEVIFFDGGKWDYVLNNLYIPKDDKDREDYLAYIKKLGVKDEFNFISGKYKGLYPEIERKIKNSWERIFDIDIWNKFSVQANLWQIKKEWIKHIVYPGENLFDIADDMEEQF